MNSDEFWCRAFLKTMATVFQACIGTGAEESSVAAQCADMADAALAVAQRRGMVTAERATAGIEFTAQPGSTSAWTVTGGPADFIGREVLAGGKYYPLHDGSALRIEWSEGDRPVKALIERPLSVAIANDSTIWTAKIAPVEPGQHWRLTTTGDVFRVRDVKLGVATLVKLAPLHSGDHLRRVTLAELQDGLVWEREPEQPEPAAPELERVEFTAEQDGDIWTLRAPGWTRGVQVRTGGERYPFGPLDVLCIKWGETCPTKPIEVWLERKGGA
jgi:hypothetical protein